MRRLILVTSSFISSLALADGWRCGDRLVDVGETAGTVALKCGSPTTADRREESRRVKGMLWTVTIDQWTYDRGPRDFVRVLTFANGRLQTIDVGGYGTNQ
jgi:hypothetical protein